MQFSWHKCRKFSIFLKRCVKFFIQFTYMNGMFYPIVKTREKCHISEKQKGLKLFLCVFQGKYFFPHKKFRHIEVCRNSFTRSKNDSYSTKPKWTFDPEKTNDLVDDNYEFGIFVWCCCIWRYSLLKCKYIKGNSGFRSFILDIIIRAYLSWFLQNQGVTGMFTI